MAMRAVLMSAWAAPMQQIRSRVGRNSLVMVMKASRKSMVRIVGRGRSPMQSGQVLGGVDVLKDAAVRGGKVPHLSAVGLDDFAPADVATAVTQGAEEAAAESHRLTVAALVQRNQDIVRSECGQHPGIGFSADGRHVGEADQYAVPVGQMAHAVSQGVAHAEVSVVTDLYPDILRRRR